MNEIHQKALRGSEKTILLFTTAYLQKLSALLMTLRIYQKKKKFSPVMTVGVFEQS